MRWPERKKPTEREVIENSKTNRLYNNDFGNGRFFQVVHEDEYCSQIRFAPKTMLKIIYLKDKEDINGFEIVKLINEKEVQRVKLNNVNFQQIKDFLSFISEIDLKGITEKRIKIFNEEEINDKTIQSIKTLLSQEGGEKVLETLIDEGIISSKDIVNTSFRKKGVNIYENLLMKEEYWKIYANKNQISTYSEEKVWQYFFEKNEWIFGYGLNYKFQTIRQREMHLSDTDGDGSSAVITDFLLADNNFTSFVELKKPSTPLFGKSRNRSNAWCLSNDLIDSVSQILEQKASGELWLQEKTRYAGAEPIEQKTYNPKVILIIGSWKELENSKNTKERDIKRKTLELFRRESRNVEILTYDELFERAKFIAVGKKENTNTSSQEDQLNSLSNSMDFPLTDEDDDLPF